MKTKSFPNHKWFKLATRRDNPFKTFNRFSNNAYELELPGEFYSFHPFDVYDLAAFNIDDMF